MSPRIRTPIGFVAALGFGVSLCWGELAHAEQWCATMSCPVCGSHGFRSGGRECFGNKPSCESRVAELKRTGPSAASYSACAVEGARASTGSSDDLMTELTKNLAKGVITSNPEAAMLGLGVAMVLQGLQGDPAEDARRAEAAALAAEQRRQEEEQGRVEDLRRQELAKRRILGMLKGTEGSTPLRIKKDDSAALGASSNIALLKLSDVKIVADARASAQAGQGFDTDGKTLDLPLPPPTPTSSQSKVELLKALQAKLDQNVRDRRFLDELLETLQKTAKPDPAFISKVQEKIDSNTRDMNQLAQQIKATELVKVEVNTGPEPVTKQSP